MYHIEGARQADIAKHLRISQATVSQHLTELQEAGLIEGHTDGPRVCYCPNRDALNRLHEAMSKGA